MILDYAHTPDSLENTLDTVKEFAKGKNTSAYSDAVGTGTKPNGRSWERFRAGSRIFPSLRRTTRERKIRQRSSTRSKKAFGHPAANIYA